MNKTLSMILAATVAVTAHGESYCRLEGDTLRMGNDRIERVMLWNGGNVKTVRIENKATGVELHSKGSAPDFQVNRQSVSRAGRLKVEMVGETSISPETLEATIEYSLGGLDVRRRYRIYDGVPAIATDTWLKGNLNGAFAHADAADAADRSNIESAEAMKVKAVTPVLDRLSLAGKHWRLKAVEFWDVTDWNNNLVAEREAIAYRRTNYRGNVMLATDGVSRRPGAGFFFLKEAPCSGVQLGYDNADFIAEFGDFAVTGLGLRASDLKEDEWTPAYSTVLGVHDGSEKDALLALRSYQKKLRRHLPERDEMVMMNTWGDRSQDAKVNERFCLEELELCGRLGISLFQIDDGWQKGKSPNSAVAKGSFKDIWRDSAYWVPDAAKYPRGLKPIVDRGRELGVEIGLWFNPSVQDDFADWEKDAATLTGLYREYGIRTFKIDGLNIPTKKAETNLRKLFDRVQEETGDSAVFNLDATAGRRGGYHFFNRYGNIFLENRYTDWGNYYPYHTLRNLWQLVKYVPAENLQVEFLNPWRNAEKYDEGDPFAPGQYGFDYLFAITMAGQPLAWMEASNLPEEAFGIAPLVRAYREVQHEFHSGAVLPIGEEPSGRSWTGFQSITGDDAGFLLIFREDTEGETGKIRTYLNEGANVRLTPVLGYGREEMVVLGEGGSLTVRLPGENTFALYRYQVED
ncbi:MAG: alpha-galactosidase [Clostridium sp.]|nr:alpha-galactosidase [Clostridium sp.]